MTRKRTSLLSRPVIHRIACAVVRNEIARLRRHAERASGGSLWPEDTPLADDGLGLDSLERLGALAALAEAFAIDHSDGRNEPARSVGDWIDWIMLGHQRPGAGLAARTSGSTGAGRTIRHGVADLVAEAAVFAASLSERRRIVALVPAHHLYGIVWTALLPEELDVPVLAQSLEAPLRLLSGDLVVAVPDQWVAMSRLLASFPVGIIGVTSGGPFDVDVGRTLLSAGLDRLVDVYGSTETGAIALRDVPETTFRLMPRWSVKVDAEGENALEDEDGIRHELPDRIENSGEREIRLLGRRDGAVQVGGYNVHPGEVQAFLMTIIGVADAAVRLHADGRLKAFIVPAASGQEAELRSLVETAVAHRLSAPEQPRMLRFGSSLPRNAMGKLEDWS